MIRLIINYDKYGVEGHYVENKAARIDKWAMIGDLYWN